MPTHPFGRTGLPVTRLGFGGAEIGFENADQERVTRLLNAALDAGLKVIDTAECYVASEELIGAAVGHRRSEYALFSKCGHAGTAGLDGTDWDPRLLATSIDRSLKRLRTDRLDLLQLHSCDEATLRRGGVVRVLEDARRAGKTRFIGYSGDGAAARYAVDCGAFDALQTSLNIADQEAIDLLLPAAAARGMGVIAKRPIANAAWRYPELPGNSYHQEYWRRLRALDYPFLRRPLPEAAAIALRFTLAQPGVHVAIVGTANPGRWRENAAIVAAGPLPPAEVAAIRARWRQVAKPEWIGQT